MQEKVEQILRKLEEFDSKLSILDEIKKRIDEMWKYQNMDTYNEFPPVLYSKSPVKLSSAGQKILEDYFGKKYVEKFRDELIKEIESMKFVSPLDVQTFAQKIILTRFNSGAIPNYTQTTDFNSL
jgi:hypothetical protein